MREEDEDADQPQTGGACPTWKDAHLVFEHKIPLPITLQALFLHRFLKIPRGINFLGVLVWILLKSSAEIAFLQDGEKINTQKTRIPPNNEQEIVSKSQFQLMKNGLKSKN